MYRGEGFPPWGPTIQKSTTACIRARSFGIFKCQTFFLFITPKRIANSNPNREGMFYCSRAGKVPGQRETQKITTSKLLSIHCWRVLCTIEVAIFWPYEAIVLTDGASQPRSHPAHCRSYDRTWYDLRCRPRVGRGIARRGNSTMHAVLKPLGRRHT